jgi:hypothetical protein
LVFAVNDTANKRHAQTEALSAVAVLACRNFKDLDFRVDILNQNPLTRNTTVLTLFFGRQRASSGLFLRRFTVFVQLRYALISAVTTDFDMPCYRTADAAFIKFKVMTAA